MVQYERILRSTLVSHKFNMIYAPCVANALTMLHSYGIMKVTKSVEYIYIYIVLVDISLKYGTCECVESERFRC